MPFTNASRVVASDDQVFTTIGEEAVILGLSDGVYYGLDQVGVRVWRLIGAPATVRDVIAAVVREFDVSEERCERDVLALLQEMEQRGLVRDASPLDDQSAP